MKTNHVKFWDVLRLAAGLLVFLGFTAWPSTSYSAEPYQTDPYQYGRFLAELLFDETGADPNKYDCTQLDDLEAEAKGHCDFFYPTVADKWLCYLGVEDKRLEIESDQCIDCTAMGEIVGEHMAFCACNDFCLPATPDPIPAGCEMEARNACEDVLMPNAAGLSPAIEDLNNNNKCPYYNVVWDDGWDLAIQCEDRIEDLIIP
jgi:hypothetical protein